MSTDDARGHRDGIERATIRWRRSESETDPPLYFFGHLTVSGRAPPAPPSPLPLSSSPPPPISFPHPRPSRFHQINSPCPKNHCLHQSVTTNVSSPRLDSLSCQFDLFPQRHFKIIRRPYQTLPYPAHLTASGSFFSSTTVDELTFTEAGPAGTAGP